MCGQALGAPGSFQVEEEPSSNHGSSHLAFGAPGGTLGLTLSSVSHPHSFHFSHRRMGNFSLSQALLNLLPELRARKVCSAANQDPILSFPMDLRGFFRDRHRVREQSDRNPWPPHLGHLLPKQVCQAWNTLTLGEAGSLIVHPPNLGYLFTSWADL